MKVTFRWLAIPLILLLIAVGGNNAGLAIYTNSSSVKKSSVASQKTDLEVAVPETATIFRNDGRSSLTGSLSNFSNKDVTISANGYSETVPLTQIELIEFNGDVWIKGQALPARVRGITKTLEGLPVGSFKLDNSQKRAVISLKTMTSRGLERFLKDNANTPFGVKAIFIERSDKLRIKIAEIE
jgi:hypothetical protein